MANFSYPYNPKNDLVCGKDSTDYLHEPLPFLQS